MARQGERSSVVFWDWNSREWRDCRCGNEWPTATGELESGEIACTKCITAEKVEKRNHAALMSVGRVAEVRAGKKPTPRAKRRGGQRFYAGGKGNRKGQSTIVDFAEPTTTRDD